MTAPPQGDRHLARDQGIPVRGILIGAVLALVLNICDTYATNSIQGSYLTLNFSTPAGPLLLLLPRPGQRRRRPPPPVAGAHPGRADHDLRHAGGGLLHPRHGLHPVHHPLPPRVDLLRHAREQLGRALQPVHPGVDDPPRRERGPLLLRGDARGSLDPMGSLGRASGPVVRLLPRPRLRHDLRHGRPAQAVGRQREAQLRPGAGADGDDAAGRRAAPWAARSSPTRSCGWASPSPSCC